MNKNVLRFVVLGAVVLLTVGLLLPPGPAAAQPQPTLVLLPSSGPCDATVEVAGSRFEPGTQIPIDLGAPHSGVALGHLGVATAGPDGHFTIGATFGSLGCEAAARDAELDDPGEPKDLVIFAGYDPARESILTRAPYQYTTTTPSVVRVLPPTGDGSAASQGSGLVAVFAGIAGAGALLLGLGLSVRPGCAR
jgi:hypothetical protein